MLDLCTYDSFTLIASSRSEWADRYDALQSRLSERNIEVILWVKDEDFSFVFPEQEKLFEDGVRFSAGGGILVRPDQHILTTVAASEALTALERYILQHLAFN